MHLWQQENLYAIELAEQIRRSLHLNIPIDFEQAMQAHGLRALYDHKAPDGLYAQLELGDDAVIRINGTLHPRQVRYAVIHEIAHYLIRCRRLQVRPGRVERICQVFAANFCMPAHLVQRAADQFHGKHDLLEHLAWGFGVSKEAMLIQLKLLRIIPGHPLRTASAEDMTAARTAFDRVLADDVGDELPDPPPRRPADREIPIFDLNVDGVYQSEYVKRMKREGRM